MLRNSTLIRASLAAAALAGLSQTADAARIRIDFDDTGTALSGELFPLADSTFAYGSGAVPFLLNFGDGAKAYDFCFDQNGVVEFVAQGGACGTSPLTGNYIAPFSAAMNPGGNTSWGTGFLDLTQPYSVAGATTEAIRWIWDGIDVNNNMIATEVMLWNLGAGDFAFDLRYGNSFLDGVPDTGTRSFHLGTNILAPVSGPFLGDDPTPVFTFVGGVCTSAACNGTPPPPPTGVSEPSSATLMALTVGLLAFFGLRRRRLRNRG